MVPSTPGPRASGEIRLAVEDGVVVLHLTGEVDAAAVAAFESAGGAAPPGLLRVVDASAVTFLNSVGAVLVIRLTQPARTAGLRPVLRRPSEAALQVLRLTGLELLFDRVG
ncbi:STAS domain-containing protein [Geodermatophilus marinus]|uniref:STAS domain-containing protein n=1 Tax=Geodermatophilus sp. LHW52908 TaxID=2303986 RepID=UPI000E3ECA0D|nr:STAS domain-containing protein [Geodermatophilus sp. LHW52908]RFU22103.1 anti-sigma factor antagonist [Geodermatophilus sp. LHW52908]